MVFIQEHLYSIALQVAYGLQYLHSINLEHKDIKPANILFKKKLNLHMSTSDIHVKIADFGIAKFTQTGANSSKKKKRSSTRGTVRL